MITLASLLPYIGIGLAVVVLIAIALRVAQARVKIPTSVAAEKYGVGEPQYITGASTIVTPYWQSARYLPTWMLTIVKGDDVLRDINNITMSLNWSWQGKIITTETDSNGNSVKSEKSLRKAFENFGDFSVQNLHDLIDQKRSEDATHGLKEAIATTLLHAFRSVCGTMTIDQISADRETFIKAVQKTVEDELSRMGLETISMGVADIDDPQNYLAAKAKKEIAMVQRDAAVVEAKTRQESEQAKIDAETQILQQQEALELRRVAKEEKVGLAEASKERTVQEQRALAVEQQKRADEIIPAEAIAAAVKIRADADKVKTTVEAEATAVARTTKANAEATARKAEAGAEAEAVRVRGQAEADAIQARGEAEAVARTKLADAAAAQDRVNIDVLKIEKEYEYRTTVGVAAAEAVGTFGKTVNYTQIGGGDNGGINQIVLSLMQTLVVAQKGLEEVFGTSDVNKILKGEVSTSAPVLASEDSPETETES